MEDLYTHPNKKRARGGKAKGYNRYLIKRLYPFFRVLSTLFKFAR